MTEKEKRFTLRVMAKRVGLTLGIIAVLLAGISITGKYVQAALGENSPEAFDIFVRIFNINRELSIPTWYVSSVLLLGGLTSMVIAIIKRARREPFVGRWFGLAAMFIYFSADEAAELHEYLTEPIGEGLNTTGPLYFGWIIAGAIAVVIVGLIYFRFWLHLPGYMKRLYLLAAVLYVGGGIGIEMIGSNLWYLEGGSSLTYSTVGTVEELFEILGAVVFLYAQLVYLTRLAPVIELHVHAGAAEAVRASQEAAALEQPADQTPA
ncbi:MAG: hypothetical protein DIU68_016590 [Chloroflexota bacterium]|nr:MAG: hypothetical protein DIU68_11630 [Chloroflexota bacterium]